MARDSDVNHAPLTSPLDTNERGQLVSRPWFSFFGQLVRGVQLAFDLARWRVFDPEPRRDIEPDIRQIAEALKETAGRDIEPDIRQIVGISGDPESGRYAADIDELRALEAQHVAPDTSWRQGIEETRLASALGRIRAYEGELAELRVLIASIAEPGGQILPHAPTHQDGGSDEVATGTASAYAIPKAGSGGTLDMGWLPSTTTLGSPGVDTLVATEKAVRAAIGAAIGGITDTTNATNITSGTLNAARLPATISPNIINTTKVGWTLTSGSPDHMYWYNYTTKLYLGTDTTDIMSVAADGTVILLTPKTTSGSLVTVSATQTLTNKTLSNVSVSPNSTGAGSAALGANCPAITPTAPYKWATIYAADGTLCYVPLWK